MSPLPIAKVSILIHPYTQNVYTLPWINPE
jgi:hypothetical protein